MSVVKKEAIVRPDNAVTVLDPDGWVSLVECNASDLSAVNAARVSVGRVSTELDMSDKGLITYLVKNRHHSPFEHNQFTFLVRCPIFVAREWFRHRISSFNEISGRYAELGSDFYTPQGDAIRGQIGKAGHYTFVPLPHEERAEVEEIFENTYRVAQEAYEELLERGVAREIARCVLPVSIYTSFYWTANARSLMHFISLRNAEDAQYEIRLYAQAMEHWFAEAMPITYSAFVESGRNA